MLGRSLEHRRSLTLVCLVCTSAFVALYLCGALLGFQLGPLLQGELAARDWLIRLGRRAPADPRIVYLAIDQPTVSLDQLWPEEIEESPVLQRMSGGWPWKRDIYRLIFQRLLDAGASVVALDLIFPMPGPGDEEFKEGLDRLRDRVVIGANFVETSRGGTDFSTFDAPASTLIGTTDPGRDERIGFVNFWVDPDEVIRSARYCVTGSQISGVGAGGEFHSLTARMLRQAGLRDRVPGRCAPYQIRFADSFPTYSLYQLFVEKLWQVEPFRGGEYFRDKIVLIGPEGNWSHDFHPTPFGRMQGPLVHLNALNAALTGEFIREVPVLVNAALIVFGGLIAWALTLFLPQPFLRFLLFVVLTAGGFGIALGLYNRANLYLALLTPLLAMNVSGTVALVWEQVLERIDKARMRRTLERYVSKNVVREILDNPSSYLNTLGGVRKGVAILMTDLRDFTTITEQADSAQLVRQLNEYFGAMVEHVFAQEGTLDKFIGDALLAVWGNLQSDGPARDVERAVRCALAMQASLVDLNAGWRAAGDLEFSMGIGINYGDAICGNIGSTEKMEPTVIGDAVNLASRLEGLTKQYGVAITLGENAATLVRDRFGLRSVDYVQVKGKTRPIEVFAVEGVIERTTAADPWLEDYERAVKLYRAAEFETADELFAALATMRPDDVLVKLYGARCHELRDHPPGPDWNGVFVMTKK